MTTQQALERLDDMQGQIIHGKNTFGEIAAVIRQLELEREVRMATILAIIGGTVEGMPTSSVNYLQRLRELVANSKSPEPIWDARNSEEP